MLYKFEIGCQAPYLVEGDKAEIQGHIFDFKGEVPTSSAIPKNEIGIWRIADLSLAKMSNIYICVHPSMFTDITRAYQQAMFSQIAADHSEIPKKERPDKVPFLPPIYPENNYLTVLMKYQLYDKQVDLRDLPFQNENHRNNMKRLMVARNMNLTYDKYCEWQQLLGNSHEIRVYRSDGSLLDIDEIRRKYETNSFA